MLAGDAELHLFLKNKWSVEESFHGFFFFFTFFSFDIVLVILFIPESSFIRDETIEVCIFSWQYK